LNSDTTFSKGGNFTAGRVGGSFATAPLFWSAVFIVTHSSTVIVFRSTGTEFPLVNFSHNETNASCIFIFRAPYDLVGGV
jgi:hypothetical protein